jgi:serpin B
MPADDSAEVKAVARSGSEFAVELYRRLTVHPGNLVFSPYSVSKSLAVLCSGARGQTETQIAQILHLVPQRENPCRSLSILARYVHAASPGGGTILESADSLWCQRDYHLAGEFVKVVGDAYDAQVREADFRRFPDFASRQINSWIERATKGRITGVVQAAAPTAEIRLLSCDAIYFKGRWDAQFDPARTRRFPFLCAADRSVDVPMMQVKAKFRRLSEPQFRMLDLPYAGGTFSMVVILPALYDGLPALERDLTSDNLGVWLAALASAQPREVTVLLPRFKFTQQFNLSGELSALGMPSAFNSDADFSGLTADPGLFLADMLHSAYIEVNEEGTEAGAATVQRHLAKSMSDVFQADHPFLFIVRESRSGTILFLGRVSDPSMG